MTFINWTERGLNVTIVINEREYGLESQGRLEGPQRSVTRKRWRGGTEEESEVIIFQLKNIKMRE